MKIQYTGINVRIFFRPGNFQAMADFYEHTLQLPPMMRDETRKVAGFRLAFGPTILLEPTGAGEELPDEVDGYRIMFSLTVTEMTAVYENLVDAGVRFEGPPEKMYWGGTLAHLHDPEGNLVTLVENPAA